MIRKHLKSHLAAHVFGAAVFFSALPGLAADPENYFYPAKGWSVAAAEGKAQGRCSIGAEFNNGFAVRMDGTADTVRALSIDFRQPVFEPGQSYNTLVSVPGSLDRQARAQAADRSRIIIDMENEPQFLDSLRNASAMDVSIEGNSFRFYLTSFSNALARYESCGGIRAAEAQPAPAVVPEKSVKLAGVRDESIRKLPLEDLEEEDLTAPPPFGADAGDSVAIREILPKQELPEIEEIDSAELKEPLHRSDEFAAAAGMAPDSPSLDAMGDPVYLAPPAGAGTAADMADNEAEPIELTRKPAADDPVRYKTPESTVQTQTTTIKADFTELPAGEDNSGAREVPALVPVTDIPAAEKNYNSDLQEKIRELENRVEKLAKEKALLNEELEMALKESQEERLSISSENWNLERATMRFNEAERQIQRLGHQIQRERAHCEQEKKELESMLFDPQVTNRKQLAHLADLEQKLREEKESNELQRRKYEERIRILEEQLSSQ